MAYWAAVGSSARPGVVGGSQQPAAKPHCASHFLHCWGAPCFTSRIYQEDTENTTIRNRFGAEAQEGGRMKKSNVGSSFDSWLREEGIYEEVTATALKRVLARQLEAAMKEKQLSKAEMARRMHTSRAALNRLLDPEYDAVTLSTLRKAALAVGRQLRLELV
jgi:DNA-binding Xre family transcriptional regulator